MSTVSPWKMRKAELVKALEEMNVDVNPSWTVPELREILLEHRGERNKLAAGYTRFNLDELKNMCRETKLEMPAKPTKGCLMKVLREANSGHGTSIMDFGRHMQIYEDTNIDSRRWAVGKWRRTPTPPCPW